MSFFVIIFKKINKKRLKKDKFYVNIIACFLGKKPQKLKKVRQDLTKQKNVL
jgi:hypothetical protein